MNKRLLLALGLSALLIGVTQYLFPPPKPQPGKGAAAVLDSARKASAAVAAAAGAATPAAPGATVGALPGAAVAGAPAAQVRVDTTALTGGLSTVKVSSLGAAPVSVQLTNYRRLEDGGRKTETPVELVRGGESLVRYALVVKQAGGGTAVMDLGATPFQTTVVDPRTVRYSGQAGPLGVAITYAFVPDSYVVRVSGTVTGTTAPTFLRITLPSGLNSAEADTTEDQRHLAVAMKPVKDNARSVAFADLDPGERQFEEGPFTWVVSKSKFFITGLLVAAGDKPFDEVTVVGGPKTGKLETRVDATVLHGLDASGAFRFELYAGPQEWKRLVAMGRDFQNSNPYGGWMQGFVQPFAQLVMTALLWMHDVLKLQYGWVLVIFGVVIRLLMWPFNQKAMRSSMKMQVLQPELQAVQDKYKSDPQKMQQEVMRVYKEHGMSPFSTLSGCLPMLLPMPVFITLFFVFQNTIEFRGVPFLWLQDISQKDPTFIIPILMAVSAFLLSWIGMRNAPPNPQTKMMAYVFPAMMFVFFWSQAAGLNLYYMVQNIAALPQQWLIANERKKAPGAGAPVVYDRGAPARPKKA